MDEKRQSLGFYPQEIEPTPFERYIGQWVIIFPQHGNTFSGHLSKIEEDYLVLNPFQGAEYTSKGITRKLVSRDSIVNKHSVIAIEPTERDTLENYCTFLNNQGDKKDDI